VASAVRFIAKSVFGGTSQEFLGRSHDTIRGQLGSDKGLGQSAIVKFLEGVPGINDGTVQQALANIKAGGDHARIIHVASNQHRTSPRCGESDGIGRIRIVMSDNPNVRMTTTFTTSRRATMSKAIMSKAIETARLASTTTANELPARAWNKRDVRGFLGISNSTFYVWLDAGIIPPGVRLGGQMRWDPRVIQKLVGM
jgi:predicted DNA-binding transcriptional regulator AlpA